MQTPGTAWKALELWGVLPAAWESKEPKASVAGSNPNLSFPCLCAGVSNTQVSVQVSEAGH